MTTPARELRDALAEAVLKAEMSGLAGVSPSLSWFGNCQRFADRLLASLPSVKLKMGWEE